MKAAKPTGQAAPRQRRLLNSVMMLTAATIVSGCSASASRLDMANLLGTKKQSDDRLTTASLQPPVPAEPVYDVEARAGAASDPSAAPRAAAAPGRRVERIPLPETRAARKPERPRNHDITIRRGDTLYSLARRYEVSVADIKAANSMRSSRLREGQSLIIPTGYQPATYTVQRGDSIYSIARRLDVSHRELASFNRISRPSRIRPGQTLVIPGRAGAERARDVAAAGQGVSVPVASPTRDRPTRLVRTHRIPAADGGRKTGEPVRVASRSGDIPLSAARTAPERRKAIARKKVAAKPPAALPEPAPMIGTKFRWPVRGRIISEFGAKPNGKKNDGINVAVPRGTSVKAAENGVVAYAGSELKGYGNLVLIRHDDDWVTAYAHNEKLTVKRGDKVRRGQVIAKAGKSGNVGKPQLHFELRKGSKPVNPLKYMASR